MFSPLVPIWFYCKIVVMPSQGRNITIWVCYKKNIYIRGFVLDRSRNRLRYPSFCRYLIILSSLLNRCPSKATFLQMYTQFAIQGRDICLGNLERYLEGLFSSQFKIIERVRAVYPIKRNTQSLNFTKKYMP